MLKDCVYANRFFRNKEIRFNQNQLEGKKSRSLSYNIMS